MTGLQRGSRIALWSVVLLVSAAWALPSHAISVPGQGTWESTLQGRDLDGNLATFEAYYDTVLGITWLVDANYALTSGYDTQGHVDGRLSWDLAKGWVDSLDPYGSGVLGWRLPTIVDLGSPGCDYSFNGTDCGYNVDTSSEMAHMFSLTLGNLAYHDILGNPGQPGWGLTNTGPFLNLLTDGYYWTGTAVNAADAFGFHFGQGRQRPRETVDTSRLFSWAVHSGDVGTPVPLPASAWLLFSGIAGLGFIARRRAVV